MFIVWNLLIMMDASIYKLCDYKNNFFYNNISVQLY